MSFTASGINLSLYATKSEFLYEDSVWSVSNNDVINRVLN